MERYTILLIGGGEGSGQIRRIAHQLDCTVSEAQLIIVAGRNQPLKRQLDAISWQIPTRVYGFVDNMPELMYASDILITKAGPGTISEAFMAGLPSLISGYIPGQETGNVAYIQANGAGAYMKNPADIAHLVRSWMSPENLTVQRMAANATRLARPQAALAIAADLCQNI